MVDILYRSGARIRIVLAREKALVVLLALTMMAVTMHEVWGTKARRSWRDHPHAYFGAAPKSFRPAVRVPRIVRDWRNGFIAGIKEYDTRGLARGIFLGDTSDIAGEDETLFREAGLSHLLAASGFNCWIVALAFGTLARLGLHAVSSRLRSAAAIRARRLVGPISELTGAWLFWLWTDQSPPITRCAATVTVKALFETMALTLPFTRLLFVQYLASLIVLPRLWHSASFQLTFGCLFGILAFPRLVSRFAPNAPGWRRSAWNYLAVGTGACLGTLPTTWIVFGTLNFSSLATNWFAVPIVSFGIMPAALIAMLLIPLSWAGPWIEPVLRLLFWAASALASSLHLALELWQKTGIALHYP